jgi:hypothetical protein
MEFMGAARCSWQNQGNVCGLPFFLNPTTPIVLANLIEHFKQSVVEVGAYKYGATAMLLMPHGMLGSKVIALNPQGLDDDPWFQQLKSKPWASRLPVSIGTAISLPNSTASGCIGCFQLALCQPALSNDCANTQNIYEGCHCYHGDSHQETPGFIADIACSTGMKEIELVYEPPGGTWCSNGIFEFDNTKA